MQSYRLRLQHDRERIELEMAQTAEILGKLRGIDGGKAR